MNGGASIDNAAAKLRYILNISLIGGVVNIFCKATPPQKIKPRRAERVDEVSFKLRNGVLPRSQAAQDTNKSG